jgi:hypothetical protein
MSQVHIGQAHHPYGGCLDHRYRMTGRVDHDLPRPGLRQRLAAPLIICDQASGRSLATCDDRGDELIAQRSGEGELRDRQILRSHGSKPSDERRLRALPRACLLTGVRCGRWLGLRR